LIYKEQIERIKRTNPENMILLNGFITVEEEEKEEEEKKHFWTFFFRRMKK